MLRLASKRVALPSRRALVRLQSTKPPLPPPATTPLPPPETVALPPPGATATAPPPPPPPPAQPAEPLVTPPPAPPRAPEVPKVELPRVELPKVPEPAAPKVDIPSPAPAVHHAAAAGKGAASRLKSLLVSSLLFLGTGALLVYAYDSRAGIHRWMIQPAFMALTKDDPELAHEIAVKLLSRNLGPVDCGKDDERLAFELWGKKFDNPIGIAAGFDKHAEAIDGLFNLGFGYVEVGSITPEPQPGNPKPRVFRVEESNSVVNRYGFNSEGHSAALARLRRRVIQFVSDYAALLPPALFPTQSSQSTVAADFNPIEAYLESKEGSGAAPADAVNMPRSLKPGKVLGINLGKNKVSDPDSIDDFVKGIAALGPYADVLVVNVSSPNTPGLRNLQRKGMLSELLEGVVAARNLLPTSVKPPVLVKVAPDLDDEQLSDIAYAAKSSGVDGVIVSNTTISRPASAGTSTILQETGGLSGPPVKELALRALSGLYEQTDGKIPLVGCGGISSGQDALDYAKAGASLVQLYTGFVYGGVGLSRRIKDELAELLQKEGKAWKDVIGTGRAVKKVAPAPAASSTPSSSAEIAKPSKEDFEKELGEAKQELEALFKELARADKPASPTASESAEAPIAVAPKDAAAPVAVDTPVPALVAESIPTSADPAATTSAAANSSSEAVPVSPLNPAPTPTIVRTAPEPKIDETKLAVPAEALLDEKAIAALLDPAVAQVQTGKTSDPQAGKEKLAEAAGEAKSPLGEKRWV
ncbi:hypothetical protein JCM10908_001955 [Rhodotorula pacifica]|uniref:uncharacterized protein n=1 Tax=Rhodotorula pacifica TaxID=1495444 RepID=UPI0031748C1B